MNKILVSDILKLCDAKLLYGRDNLECNNFSKDTREINKDDVYVGIKGEKFDGNLFYNDAFDKGASVCILEHIDNIEDKYKDKTIILVEDSIKCLQTLATYKRSLYNIPVVAVTGSVGKTSTKDIIASVLSKKYNVLKTEGNNNNHIGLPLTILKLDNHEVLVVEMGMNNLGEISLLSKIASPTIGVITNVGTAHIGNLGSRENILKAKLEIIDGMDKNGILIVNNDNDLLTKINIGNKVINIGIDSKSDYNAKNIKEDIFSSTFEINNKNFGINVGSKVFVYNSLFAYAIGKCLNLTDEEIKRGIKDFKLSPHRQERKVTKDEVILIDDTYNANYDSMSSSLSLLGKTKNRKVAILGSMLELGEYSKDIHENIGKEVKLNNIDILVTVGNEAKYIAKEAIKNGFNEDKVYSFDKENETYSLLDKILIKDDIVLLKGSHSIELYKIVDYLMNK